MSGDDERTDAPATVPIVLPPSSIDGRLDPAGLFGRGGDLVLEIGSGKGKFLAEESRAHPDRNYLGVERSAPWLRKAEERLRKAGASNVRLLQADAKDVLLRLLPDGSVAELHVYFPDPWPKKRHRKRRLFDPGTAALMEGALRPGGELHVATDDAGYFEAILEAISSGTRLRRVAERSAPGAATSSFAVKYLREGRGIRDAVFVRDSVAPPRDRE